MHGGDGWEQGGNHQTYETIGGDHRMFSIVSVEKFQRSNDCEVIPERIRVLSFGG